MATIAEEIEEFLEHSGVDLEHAGVKGMKWGKTKAGQSGQSSQSFFNKPSAVKAVLVGSYGKKSAYTNPEALAIRKRAGKIRIASVLTSAGGTAISLLGKNNGGAQVVASLLNSASGGLMIGATVTGAIGANSEAQSRKANGI